MYVCVWEWTVRNWMPVPCKSDLSSSERILIENIPGY